ncbi:retinoic acid-induced protein 1 [Thalassophryne amazonica]|uniref:retinoic acid-induced protein 1 n=1 Tax=Thalassophryne amazonica TaxID=390379 RepID=UPI0014713CE3|nr:retinoic acid-induced protein 1 [Thalassophryne amazonica]
MEQPGSLDDLQPEDLSTSSIPTVIDLTRKGKECVLRMIKNPGWYPNAGTNKPALPFSDTGSTDITVQSGDQIQPDNALSQTTVTLSYVSRSHIFSTHDSLTQQSPLYSIPPISKFSTRPSCDSENGLRETGYAPSQHYVEQDSPMDLANQTELFQSWSQTQVGHRNKAGLHVTQQPYEFNGVAISSDGDVDKQLQDREGSSIFQDVENSDSLENGQGDSWSSLEAYTESSPETLTPIMREEEDRLDSQVAFLISRNQDSSSLPDKMGASRLCSLSRDYTSPLDEPVSPSAASVEDVEDVFLLPQTSNSPSGDNSVIETSDDAVWNSWSKEGTIPLGSCTRDNLTRLESQDKNTLPVHRGKAVLEPHLDLAEGVFAPGKPVIPYLNGNVKVLQRTLQEKKLPVRSGRGTRLEAIVMNLNSRRYKVSGCIQTSKDTQTSLTPAPVSDVIGPKNPKKKGGIKKKKKAVARPKRGKTNNNNTVKNSTSDCKVIKTPKMQSSQLVVQKKSRRKRDNSHLEHSPQTDPSSLVNTILKRKLSQKEPEQISHPNCSQVVHVVRTSQPAVKPPKKHQAKGKTSGSKITPTAKTLAARCPKRRRKKHKQSPPSSLFSPKEPEIRLKYVNYKEEKRDPRLDNFCPFVHVERHESSPSLCTVINYPEEVQAQHRKGQQQPSGAYVSAIIPSTTCLQIGRVSMHSWHQCSLVCCLCGRSANAVDLGDLHGPYYPKGYRPKAETPVGRLSLRDVEDEYSDSDSSYCSVRGRGRKCAPSSALWPVRAVSQPTNKVVLDNNWRTSGRDGTNGPAVTRARWDPGAAEDWYNPPVVPLEPCEYWLHEDCAIWTAGVFLVKGKVYGLEEAVKVAQETLCSFCRCHGATLGCFFKACNSSYHYRCALESGCVLIEENFSMKCPKHKSKIFKAPQGSRWDGR